MKWKNTAAWSYSLGLAWRPNDWQESKATVRSHTAGHTVYPVNDEPHPHREAINRLRGAGSPVVPSPMRCAFHRFTPVVSSDRSPLLLLARCGTNSARERVILFWRGTFTFISPPRRLLWNNIKNLNLKIKSMGIILNSEKYEETWLRGRVAKMTRRADFCKR